MRMNAVQIRAAIFAVRTNLARIRRLRYDLRSQKSEDKAQRKWKAEEKVRLKVDDNSFALARRRAPRTIASLERHLKRANRLLISSTSREEYDARTARWRQHLRWMRLHIAYFKSWPTVLPGMKTRQQRQLDELAELAKLGIRDAGLKAVDDVELRRLMRLYARSARGGTKACGQYGSFSQTKET